MKKLSKGRNSNFVRRLFSKTHTTIENIESTESRDLFIPINTTTTNDDLMLQENQLSIEIKFLKEQIINLKSALNNLQKDIEKKETAIAKLATEKEHLALDLLKQKRTNNSLLKQLEDERQFYYSEKKLYCQEMNEIKKLKRTLSNSLANTDQAKIEQYRKEIATTKEVLKRTMEANYNVGVKFLRMRNTKMFIKNELKSLKMEHRNLMNNYKSKIEQLSKELNQLVNDKFDKPVSCSSKKYLLLIKQNGCLIYENVCLQQEIKTLRSQCTKLSMESIKAENKMLKFVKHLDVNHKERNTKEVDHKRVRVKENSQLEQIEKTSNNILISSNQSSSKAEIVKLFEKTKTLDNPEIRILKDPPPRHVYFTGNSSNSCGSQSVIRKELFPISNGSSEISGIIIDKRIQRSFSSPEITNIVSSSYTNLF